MDHKQMLLALYPNAKGFGYALMDKVTEPWECGVHEVRPISNGKCLKQIAKFISQYRPAFIILLECESKKYAYKRDRVKRLVKDVAKYATKNNIEVRWYNREQIRFVFEQYKAKTKYEIAQLIITWLPKFKNKLPEPRKFYLPEDYKLGVFDALSLAITHYYYTS